MRIARGDQQPRKISNPFVSSILLLRNLHATIKGQSVKIKSKCMKMVSHMGRSADKTKNASIASQRFIERRANLRRHRQRPAQLRHNRLILVKRGSLDV